MENRVSKVTTEIDDYMSDTFLNQAEKYQKTIPITTLSKKRKEPENIKPLKQLEEDNRVEALKTSLSESNKGFQLLAMMGYKKGDKLGKEGNKVAEPIEIHVKTGRAGLGVEEDKRRKIQQETEKVVEQSTTIVSSFKDRASNKFTEKKKTFELKQLLKICKEMDLSNNTISSVFYKSEDEYTEEEQEAKMKGIILQKEEFEILEISDRVTKLLYYLREKYLYCFYCVCKYSNEEELSLICPGITEEEHDE